MVDVHGSPTPAEDEYFRRQDQEPVARAKDGAVRTGQERHLQGEQRALGVTLGIGDDDVVARLYDFGLRSETAWLLGWVPAMEVASLGGIGEAERTCLRDLIAKVSTDAPVAALLDAWCMAPAGLFESARLGLRIRMAGMPVTEREHLRDRVLASCATVGRASGGVLGFGALSAEERQLIDAIRADLERVP